MLFLLTAMAAPVHNGVQAQIHPAGFAFLHDALGDTSIDIGPIDLAAEVSCYSLEVTDFNLEIEVESVTLTPSSQGLEIDVELEARGTYFNVTGETGWLDTCFDFERLIELVELQQGHLHGTLSGEVTNGRLDLEFLDRPEVTGTFISDIDWFPDSLVWDYVEDLVLERAVEALETQVPPLVSDLTSETLFVDVLGTFPVGFALTDVQTDQDGLYAGVSIDLGGAGGQGEVLDLSPRGGSHFAVGVTEPLVTDLLAVGWDAGLLDLESASNQLLVADLIAGLGLGPDLEVSLALGAVPAVDIGDSGVHLSLEDVRLQVSNGGADLLVLVADLGARLDVSVAAGSFVLSAHDVTIAIEDLQADGLLTEEGSEEDVQNFLEGWVARAASVAVNEMPIYATNVELLDTVIRADTIQTVDGGIAIWASLFDTDDPAVDRTAPETTLELFPQGTSITTQFAASDDREGPLRFSWRIDGGGWSSWTAESQATFEVEPGFHTVEVISRDAWYNVDDSPALGQFQLDEPTVVEPSSRGGCSTLSWSAGLWLGLVGLLTRRRGVDAPVPAS